MKNLQQQIHVLAKTKDIFCCFVQKIASYFLYWFWSNCISKTNKNCLIRKFINTKMGEKLK